MHRLRHAAVLLGVAGLVSACGGSSNTKTAGTPPVDSLAPATSSAAPTPSTTASTATDRHGVGSTIDLKGQQAGNVLSVELVMLVDPAHPANQYAAANAGSHLVAVQLRITNHGHSQYTGDPALATKVRDGHGDTYSASITTPTSAGPAMPPALNIMPGDSAQGFVVFEVPNGERVASVQYAANTIAGVIGQWTVG